MLMHILFFYSQFNNQVNMNRKSCFCIFFIVLLISPGIILAKTMKDLRESKTGDGLRLCYPFGLTHRWPCLPRYLLLWWQPTESMLSLDTVSRKVITKIVCLLLYIISNIFLLLLFIIISLFIYIKIYSDSGILNVIILFDLISTVNMWYWIFKT